MKIEQPLGVKDNLERELCLFIEYDKSGDEYLVLFSIGRDGKLFGNHLPEKKRFPDAEKAKKYLIDRLNVFKLHRFVRDYRSSLHPTFQEIKRFILSIN